jgi:transposase
MALPMRDSVKKTCGKAFLEALTEWGDWYGVRITWDGFVDSVRGAVMAKPLLPDALWELIRPLLPPPKPRRFRSPGRKPIGDRQALTGILFVLKTGIPWEDLPIEMGCGCGMTCWRRLAAWQEAGVWEELHWVLLDRLHAADRIDWSRAIVDSASLKAVLGGKKQGQTRPIAASVAASTT